MGLNCSHGAFDGAYSAFNRLRQFVCAATGGSFPPHMLRGPGGVSRRDAAGRTMYLTDIDPECFYLGADFKLAEWPGLVAFLAHSDCGGEFSPQLCTQVADDLERLLPAMEALGWGGATGHLVAAGGYIGAVRRFMAGCRGAAAANESLIFD